MAPPLRIAVAGAGLIGARHARLIAAEPAARLAAIVDPDVRGSALAAALGVPHHASVGALCAARGADALIVATPNQAHETVGVAAAQAGLHLLVEKPIAHDLASAQRLIAAAQAAKVGLLVGHHRRYHPFVARARALLDGGTLGRLVAISAHWALRKHDAYFADAWRLQAGGGPILINLIHDIDMLRHLCGDIVDVRALGASAARGHAVVDTAAVALRFVGGALATVLMSDAAPSPWNWESATGENPSVPEAGEPCYRFFGTAAALEFPRLRLWRHDGAGPGDWSLPLSADDAPGAAPGPGEPLRRQLQHFIAVAHGREAPLVSGPDGLASLAATLEVARAAVAAA
ncbi:MAG: Gfo/Idh/MocA family oxidoreductase [Alphaproteobacteria bacterium]